MKISKEKIEILCDSLRTDTANIADILINNYEIYRQQLINTNSPSMLGYGQPHCSGGVCIEPRK